MQSILLSITKYTPSNSYFRTKKKVVFFFFFFFLNFYYIFKFFSIHLCGIIYWIISEWTLIFLYYNFLECNVETPFILSCVRPFFLLIPCLLRVSLLLADSLTYGGDETGRQQLPWRQHTRYKQIEESNGRSIALYFVQIYFFNIIQAAVLSLSSFVCDPKVSISKRNKVEWSSPYYIALVHFMMKWKTLLFSIQLALLVTINNKRKS